MRGFQRTRDYFNENDLVRRVSIGGLVLAFLWLLSSAVSNTDRVGDLIDESTVEEKLVEQQDQLDAQDLDLEGQEALIQQSITEIGKLHDLLETSVGQTDALLRQLAELKVQPVVSPISVVRLPPRVPAPTSTTTTTDKAPGQNKDKTNKK